MALKKATKRIVISSEAVNSYRFRTLTAGIELARYNNNPVLLWMHFRATGSSVDEVLPIGIVTDLKIENGKLTGLPEFDDADEFAMKLYDKYEAGILRMSSAGLMPIEWSDDKKLLLPGQEYPTLVKSALNEVSLVDIGSNPDALAYDVVLYDESDRVIDLSETNLLKLFSNDKTTTMNKDQLSLAALGSLLELKSDPSAEDVTNAVKKLITDKAAAEKKLSDLEAAVQSDKVTALVDGAEAAKKITADQKPHFTKLATADYATAKAVLDSMKPYVSVEAQLASAVVPPVNDTELGKLRAMSAQELWDADKLEALKVKDLPLFKLRFKELFGEEYKD